MSNFQKIVNGVPIGTQVQGTDIGSGPAISGWVLTADGSGNSSFVAPNSPTTFGSRSSPLAIVAADGLVGGTNVSTTALVQVSFVKGSGGPITISASPAIAAGTIVGQELQIIGRDSTNTVTIPNQIGYVELNGPCTLGAGDMLTVICDGTVWTEKCRSN